MLHWSIVLLAVAVLAEVSTAFHPSNNIGSNNYSSISSPSLLPIGKSSNIASPSPLSTSTSLFSRVTPDRSDPTADSADNPGDVFFAIQSDELVLGLSGSVAALVVFYSEYILSQTGCGLPAGPGGIVGAVEGLSYLEVAGIFILSLVNKVTSGSGLPAGKYGALGLAEGLSFLAVIAGVGVLAFQMTHYGYVPNAVPMEGGMCQ